ncbi:MAG: subtilosin A family bacteriocin [bacterium]
MNQPVEENKLNRRDLLAQSGWMSAGLLFAAAALQKNAFSQDTEGTEPVNGAAKMLHNVMLERGFQRIRVCKSPFAQTTLTMHLYRLKETETFGTVMEMNNPLSSQAAAQIVSPENLRTFTGNMTVFMPVEGGMFEETISIAEFVDQFSFRDPLRPTIPTDIKAASGCASCSACAACAACLADGPIPDFEVAGIVGLGGLWGLAAAVSPQ